MYVDSKDGNTMYRLYFIAFYYFSVLIGINIVVAYTIDMYTSVERLDEERQRTLELVRKEMAEAAEGSSGEGGGVAGGADLKIDRNQKYFSFMGEEDGDTLLLDNDRASRPQVQFDFDKVYNHNVLRSSQSQRDASLKKIENNVWAG